MALQTSVAWGFLSTRPKSALPPYNYPLVLVGDGLHYTRHFAQVASDGGYAAVTNTRGLDISADMMMTFNAMGLSARTLHEGYVAWGYDHTINGRLCHLVITPGTVDDATGTEGTDADTFSISNIYGMGARFFSRNDATMSVVLNQAQITSTKDSDGVATADVTYSVHNIYGLYSDTQYAENNSRGDFTMTISGGKAEGVHASVAMADIYGGKGVTGASNRNNFTYTVSGANSIGTEEASDSTPTASSTLTNITAMLAGVYTDTNNTTLTNQGAANNSGTLTMNVQGGMASAKQTELSSGQTSTATANISRIYGMRGGASATNSGTITMTVNGGDAMAYEQATAEVNSVSALYTDNGGVTNSGTVNLTVSGGTVTATGTSSSNSGSIGSVFGIRGNTSTTDPTNSGTVNVTITGSSVNTAGALDRAEVYNVYGARVTQGQAHNTGGINVTIIGGNNSVPGASSMPGTFLGDITGITGMAGNSGAINDQSIVVDVTRSLFVGNNLPAETDLAVEGVHGLEAENGLAMNTGTTGVTIQFNADQVISPDLDTYTVDVIGVKGDTAVNTGSVAVLVGSDEQAADDIYDVAGIEADGAVTNSGDIQVTVHGTGVVGTTTQTPLPDNGNSNPNVMSTDAIYGIDSSKSGSITSSGSVTVNAMSTGEGEVTVIGLDTTDNVSSSSTGTVENTGTVNVHGESTSTAAGTHAVTVVGIDSSGDVTAIGTVRATARTTGNTAEVYGVDSAGDAANGTSTTVGISSSGTAAAYGIKANSVTSAGTVSVSSTVGTTASSTAYGIDATGSVSGVGDLTVTSSSKGTAIGTGITATGSVATVGSVTMNVTSGDSGNATGIGINAAGAVTNVSSVSMNVVSGGTTAATTSAVSLSSAGDGTVVAKGIVAGDEVSSIGAIDVRGATTTTGAVTATGIEVSGGSALGLEANMRVVAESTNTSNSAGSVTAYGVNVTGAGAVNVEDSVTVTVSASGNGDINVHGVKTQGAVTVGGLVDVTATPRGDGTTYVAGVEAGGAVTVTGAVDVEAEGNGDITAYGVIAGEKLTVAENVTVHAKSLDGQTVRAATTRMVSGNRKTFSSSLLLSAPETQGSSTTNYVASFAGTGDNYIKEYAMRLTPSSEGSTMIEGENTFDVADGAGLSFDSESTLNVYTGKEDRGFKYNTFYTLPQLDGATTSEFYTVRPMHIEHELYVVRSNDDGTGYITELSLGYVPQDTVLSAIVRSQQTNALLFSETINRQIANTLLNAVYKSEAFTDQPKPLIIDRNITSIVAEKARGALPVGLRELTPAPPKPPQGEAGSATFFAFPYVNHSRDTQGMIGYKSLATGITLGANYQPTKRSLLGGHIGYTNNILDFTSSDPMYNSREDTQSVFSFGLQGIYSFTKNFFVRGIGTYFYTEHDYSGLGGETGAVEERADFSSNAVLVSCIGGYHGMWKKHIFTPEIGLRYYYVNQEEFLTGAEDEGGMNTTYGGYSNHEGFLVANMRWAREFLKDELTILPSLGFGFQQVLTGGRTSISQSVPGSKDVDFSVDTADQLYTLYGSVSLTKGPSIFSIGYDGAYARDIASHSIWTQLEYSF